MLSQLIVLSALKLLPISLVFLASLGGLSSQILPYPSKTRKKICSGYANLQETGEHRVPLVGTEPQGSPDFLRRGIQRHKKLICLRSQDGCSICPFQFRVYLHTLFFLFGVLDNFLLWVILYPPPIPNQEKGKTIHFTEK